MSEQNKLKHNKNGSIKRNSHEYIVEDEIKRAILKLSLPVMFSSIVSTTYNLVDSFFLGKLSYQALAASALVFPISFFFFAIIIGVNIATNIFISRYLGNKNIKKANLYAHSGIIYVIIISLIEVLFTLTLLKQTLHLMNVPEDVFNLGFNYVKIMLLSFPLTAFASFFDSIVRAEGNTKFSFIVNSLSAITNIIFDYLLIFGKYGFPRLGIEGAAIATAIARIVAFAMFGIYVFLVNTTINLNIFTIIRDLFNPETHLALKEIISKAWPLSITRVIIALTSFILNRIVSYFGSVALAAATVVFRIESVIFMIVIASGSALTTFVAHNHGARKIKRILEGLKFSMKFNVSFMILGALIFVLFGKYFVLMFNNTPEVIKVAQSYFVFVTWSYVFWTASFIYRSFLDGLGKTHYGLWFTLTRGLAIFILGEIAKHYSINAVWFVFALGDFAPFILARILYTRELKLLFTKNHC